MKKIVIPGILLFIFAAVFVSLLTTKESEQEFLPALKARIADRELPSVDHSKFQILKTKFSRPQDVTKACISCHTGRADEVMHSNHWNWEREEYIEGRGIVRLGKKNGLNNFCIGSEGNEKSCAKCHIGFGMDKNSFDFKNPENVDCLICHDNSETYAKAQEQGGMPEASLDLNFIATHVGKPKRSNCGVCHFFGGGGNNVKHGDLEKSMFEPSREIDVHMASDGMNMQCTDCHTTKNHKMAGKLYSLSSMNRNRSSCEQCHTASPHDSEILNEHTLKVACQTCHIPVFAKDAATKTQWDWSTAGKLKNGEPYTEEDKDGNHTYMSIKGSFKWAKNLKPDYIWFNGTAGHYLLGDKVKNLNEPLQLNRLYGSYNDPDAKIIPVKMHYAYQPFDPVNRILIQPKLYSDNKGEGAFWKDFDWIRASETGMKTAGLPFSGKVSFIRTAMTWPVNHMVSAKGNTVSCIECHTPSGSRLAGLNDFYMPARDRSSPVETAGQALIFLTMTGVFLHAGLRIYSSAKRKRGGK